MVQTNKISRPHSPFILTPVLCSTSHHLVYYWCIFYKILKSRGSFHFFPLPCTQCTDQYLAHCGHSVHIYLKNEFSLKPERSFENTNHVILNKNSSIGLHCFQTKLGIFTKCMRPCMVGQYLILQNHLTLSPSFLFRLWNPMGSIMRFLHSFLLFLYFYIKFTLRQF